MHLLPLFWLGDRWTLVVLMVRDAAGTKAVLAWAWMQSQAQRIQDPNVYASPQTPFQHIHL